MRRLDPPQPPASPNRPASATEITDGTTREGGRGSRRGAAQRSREDGACLSLSQRGFWAIHNQAFRIENQVRLHLGIGKLVAETPGLKVDLIQPDRADATLFLANPLSLAARREILENAYTLARAALARRELGATLAA